MNGSDPADDYRNYRNKTSKRKREKEETRNGRSNYPLRRKPVISEVFYYRSPFLEYIFLSSNHYGS